MDAQLQQLRQRIIQTVVRRLLVGFGIALVGTHVALNWSSTLTSTESIVRSILVAECLLAGWLAGSIMLNPLGGRYLRRLAVDESPFVPSKPDEGAPGRISDVGLPGLRSVATLTCGGDASVDVFQTTDTLVTIVLDPDEKHISAVSRLTDGRLFYTSDLMIVPNEAIIVNLKPGTSAVDLLDSHVQLMRKLGSMGLDFVPSSAGISLDALALERRALAALGPIAGMFLGLSGKSGSYRLMVSPTREDLLKMGLSYRQSPSLTPRPHSSVRSTDFKSNEATVSPSSA